MLKITVHDSPRALRLQLEGRLSGPWVSELEQCWRTAPARRRRSVLVDLADVDFVDAAGHRLLSLMHDDGAKLVAATPVMRALVAEITAKKEASR